MERTQWLRAALPEVLSQSPGTHRSSQLCITINVPSQFPRSHCGSQLHITIEVPSQESSPLPARKTAAHDLAELTAPRKPRQEHFQPAASLAHTASTTQKEKDPGYFKNFVKIVYHNLPLHYNQCHHQKSNANTVYMDACIYIIYCYFMFIGVLHNV